jgi:hypothetical protein
MSKLKLLQESTIDTNLIIKPLYETELNLAGEKVKRLKIEGTAIVTDIPGINGRSYPKKILGPEVARFVKKYMAKGRAAAELNHPRLDEEGNGKDYSVFEMNLSKTCALFEELKFNGNELYCKMRVCEKHPAGAMLKALIDDGYIPGFSLRGAGSVVDSGRGYLEIADDYRLITIDVVGNPSFDEKALITPVYESLKGNKVKILTESVETSRKEMIFNQHLDEKIRTGLKSFDKKLLTGFLESVDKEYLFNLNSDK